MVAARARPPPRPRAAATAEPRLWSAVWSVIYQISRRARRNARAVGLTAPQLWILQAVRVFGPLASAELAHELDVTRPTITSAVNHLARLGYLRRRRPASDRRKSVVEMTPAGDRQLERLWKLQSADHRALGALLPRRDRTALTGLLGRFAQRLEAHDPSRRSLFGVVPEPEAHGR